MVDNETNPNSIVAVTGRWMPIHNGHKAFLINFAKSFKKIVVMIGSCFENGTSRNCIPAIEREKMLRAIFERENIPEEKFEIVHVADAPTFEEWIYSIRKVCNSRGVTHFCTGNKEDILNVLEEKNEDLGFEMINPETLSNFPYHATDIRKLIIEGNYNELVKLIPQETLPILFRNTFKEIIASSNNNGLKIVPGRQTVDIVFLVRNTSDGKIYVLLGGRSSKKVDFPGFLGLPGGEIEEFESPISAAVRNFYNETGLKLQIINNSMEPAIVTFSNVPKSNLEQLFIVGIYSSEDKQFAGTRGGSSQCFGVFVEGELFKYQEYLKRSDNFIYLNFFEVDKVLKQEFAYQHKEMIQKAIIMFNAYPTLEAVKPTT